MTTLDLARAIADAVFIALHPSGMGPNRDERPEKDPPTQAVLTTLRETNHWFCRLTIGPRGETVETQMELWP